jgi:hypothetical protein
MLRLHPLQRGPRLPRVYPRAGSTGSMDALLPAGTRSPRFAWSARVAPQDWRSSRCSAWTSDNSMSNGNPILGPMFGCVRRKNAHHPSEKSQRPPRWLAVLVGRPSEPGPRPQKSPGRTAERGIGPGRIGRSTRCRAPRASAMLPARYPHVPHECPRPATHIGRSRLTHCNN